MINPGVRIELYEKVGFDEPSQNLRGALLKEEGIRAAALPRVGEHVAAHNLYDTSSAQLGGTSGGPFFPVRKVEHNLKQVEPDGTTAAWHQTGEPLSLMVLHAECPEGEMGARALRWFAANGWYVHVLEWTGPLAAAWDAAQATATT